jgi:hypothetical protein
MTFTILKAGVGFFNYFRPHSFNYIDFHLSVRRVKLTAEARKQG